MRKRDKNIVCVYRDINGLHEMNNTKGHYAGDSMLQTVAEEIKKRYYANKAIDRRAAPRG